MHLAPIPLGIVEAVRDGTPFDVWTSAAIVVGYAVPGLLFAILLGAPFTGGGSLDEQEWPRQWSSVMDGHGRSL